MFALTMAGGQNMAVPDTCITPIPSPAGPIPTPLPYPNMSTCATAIPATVASNVLINCMPALNMTSMIPMSQGDNVGVNMGVASGTVMGPTSFVRGSTAVLLKGAPAVRVTDSTIQNSTNCPGVSLVPTQPKVLILK